MDVVANRRRRLWMSLLIDVVVYGRFHLWTPSPIDVVIYERRLLWTSSSLSIVVYDIVDVVSYRRHLRQVSRRSGYVYNNMVSAHVYLVCVFETSSSSEQSSSCVCVSWRGVSGRTCGTEACTCINRVHITTP